MRRAQQEQTTADIKWAWVGGFSTEIWCKLKMMTSDLTFTHLKKLVLRWKLAPVSNWAEYIPTIFSIRSLSEDTAGATFSSGSSVTRQGCHSLRVILRVWMRWPAQGRGTAASKGGGGTGWEQYSHLLCVLSLWIILLMSGTSSRGQAGIGKTNQNC